MLKDRILNGYFLGWALVLAWALYLFYPFKFTEPGISADGVTYIHIAKNFVLDGSPGWQATWTAPFFSLLIASLYPLTGNYAVAGMMVSKIMTLFLPVGVFLLARSIFNTRIGFAAAILTALHPHFISVSGSLEPEMTYTTLLVFSAWAIYMAFKQGKMEDEGSAQLQPSACGSFWAILSGILSGLAYQTRSEGLFIFIFMISFFFLKTLFEIRELKSEASLFPRFISRLIMCSIIVIVFALTSLPYLVFLKDTYGKWVLSPKSSYVQIWMKWRIYNDYPKNNFTEPEIPELWGLSKKGKLLWQEPKGTSDLFSYLMSHPEKSMKVYLRNFSMQIPGRIPNNSGQWLYPQVYPWYFVIPAFLWILISVRMKEGIWDTLFLLSPLLILFILPVFTEGWWKYLLPYSPFIIIIAVAGMVELFDKYWRYALQIVSILIVVYSLWVVNSSRFIKHGSPDINKRYRMAEEQKKAGQWAKKRFHGTPNYMVKWSKLAYYLDGRWTAMPVANYNGMIWYARKNNVDYLVFETYGRDESDAIAMALSSSDDIDLAGIYESESQSYGAVFMRLKK